MNENRKHASNAGILGAIAIAALQAFCLGAMADETPAPVPSFNSPARNVGTYQVTGIRKISGDSNTDGCAPRDGSYPNAHCSKYFWLVRTDEQLALLEAKPLHSESTSFATGIIDGMFIHRKCDSFAQKDSAMQGSLFTGAFCRAYLNKDSSHSTETFSFSSEVPELNKLPVSTNFLDTFGLIFLAGTHVESSYAIELPRGEVSPKKIRIIETVEGTATIIPGSFQKIYSLDYISN